MAQSVKNRPSMLETWVRSLGREDLLEKGKATHSSILAYGSEASQVVQTIKSLPAMPETQVRSLGLGRSPGEGNGKPLPYSCLENPMDRGDWQATLNGVAMSRTGLSD